MEPMIQQLKRPNEATREARERAERRGPISAATSVVLHVVLAVALWQSLKVPAALERLFLTRIPVPLDTKPKEERVTFMAVRSRGVPASALPSSPSQRLAAPTREAPSPTPVAPREVPSGFVPPGRSAPAVTAPPGRDGPLVGGRGALAGTQPAFEDPRIWAAPSSPLVTAPKTAEERLDSAVVASAKRYQDSVIANAYAPNKFERGDWTVEKNGRKYGIDQNYIRLGKFSIPTPLLALLPFNRVQANPIAAEEGRRQLAMRMDIMEHAQAAMNEDEFRRAVKAIRERKERERRNQPEPAGATRRRAERPIVAPSERPPSERPPQ
ncbi:MAG: hypothetical protein MNPFHGCM_01750 [Gemmatimonadaceae bacterium]|nr:hypothetical protein [Gemmatimonadaceae bacterium]